MLRCHFTHEVIFSSAKSPLPLFAKEGFYSEFKTGLKMEEEQKKTVVHKHYYFRWVVQLACIFGAIKLMLHGVNGWGWLLFVAVCV